jgi:hypothetical protein
LTIILGLIIGGSSGEPLLGLFYVIALPIYLIPTIIAIRRKHPHSWAVGLLNVLFGWTFAGWVGALVWSLLGTPKSRLDRMAGGEWKPKALWGKATQTTSKAFSYSDGTMLSGWHMQLYAHRFFHFDINQMAISSTNVDVYFFNPIVSVFYPDRRLRFDYDIMSEIRCVQILSEKDATNTARTLGRVGLTGLGASLLTGSGGAFLGGGLLDYSFRGSEQYSILTAMIVFRDFSALAIHGQDSEFRKFIAFVPPDTCTNERIAQVTDQIDKIERLANDGTRVIAEIGGTIAQIQTQIDKYDHDLKESGRFVLRDDIRLKQERLEQQRDDWPAMLNVVRHLVESGKVIETRDTEVIKIGAG